MGNAIYVDNACVGLVDVATVAHGINIKRYEKVTFS